MTEYKLVNPDMMLSGDVSLGDECIFTMRPTVHKNNAPDADFDCPYDGTYCRQKDYKIKRWSAAVEYMATHKKNRTFRTKEDMFYGCPLDKDIQCIRKIRYEKIMQDIKQNAK